MCSCLSVLSGLFICFPDLNNFVLQGGVLGNSICSDLCRISEEDVSHEHHPTVGLSQYISLFPSCSC